MVGAMRPDLEMQMRLPLQRAHIWAGMQQGCPMSGTLYTVAVDLLARAFMAQAAMASSRIALFTDDAAVAMREMSESLAPMLAIRRAVGRALNPSKCAVISMAHDVGPYREAMQAMDEAMLMPLVWHDRCIGVEIGPGPAQWAAVIKNIRANVPDLGQARSRAYSVVLVAI